MAAINKHGLTADHIAMVTQILRPYADKITCVGLFGSRAKGIYGAHSDIDMVIKGDLDQVDIDRLYSLFDDSLIPYKIDIVAYHLVDYLPLKQHIDDVFLPLLYQRDLQTV